MSTYSEKQGQALPGMPQAQIGRPADVGAERSMVQRPHYLPQIVEMTVVAHCAGTYSYIVWGKEYPNRWACDAQGPVSVLGSREVATYSAGQKVLVYVDPENSYDVIIGPAVELDEPLLPIDGMLNVPGVPVGFGFDSTHRRVFNLDAEDEEDAYVVSYNRGRPWDTLSGDRGWVNEFHVGILLKKLTATMRTSGAEVSVSALEDEVRIAGRSIAVETPASESYTFCDQVGLSTVTQTTPHLFEGLGAFAHDAALTTYMSVDEDVEYAPGDANKRQVRQPLNWDQTGVFRSLQLAGYLGNLIHSWVIRPVSSTTAPRRSQERNWPGLAEMFVGIDGFMAFRSAKGLLLEKTSRIAVPEQRRLPRDPEGDEFETYPEALAVEKTDYAWHDEAGDPAARAYMGVDYNAFRTAQANLATVREQSEDWHVPNESDVSATDTSYASPVQDLAETFQSELPKSSEETVDYLRPGVKYYHGRAFMLFGDDGSLTLRDAYGSSIVMSGGNIEISCPGDVIHRPARRFVALAPVDAIIHGGRDAELVAGSGDLRLKADYNLHALAGNSGTGGLLFESRSTGDQMDFETQGSGTVSTGITFKADGSPLRLWGTDVYIRSLNSGQVVIDGDGSRGDVTLVGKDINLVAQASIREIVTGSRVDSVSDLPSNAALWSMDQAEILANAGGMRMHMSGSKLSLIGSRSGGRASMFLDGQLRVETSVSSPTAFQEIDPNRSPIVPSISDMRNRVAAEIEEADSFFSSTLAETVYDEEDGWGNSELVDATQFSFNTSDMYGTTSGFCLYETFWQEEFRRQGLGGTWSEPVVDFSGVDTRPWPGNKTWSRDEGYGTIDAGNFKNYDVDADAAVVAGEDDEDRFKGIAPAKVILEGHYITSSMV